MTHITPRRTWITTALAAVLLVSAIALMGSPPAQAGPLTDGRVTVPIPAMYLETPSFTLTAGNRTVTVDSIDVSTGGRLDLLWENSARVPVQTLLRCRNGRIGGIKLKGLSARAKVWAIYVDARSARTVVGPVLVDRTAEASATVC